MPLTPPADAAIFDFDGVIIDSLPAVETAINGALLAHGFTPRAHRRDRALHRPARAERVRRADRRRRGLGDRRGVRRHLPRASTRACTSSRRGSSTGWPSAAARPDAAARACDLQGAPASSRRCSSTSGSSSRSSARRELAEPKAADRRPRAAGARRARRRRHRRPLLRRRRRTRLRPARDRRHLGHRRPRRAARRRRHRRAARRAPRAACIEPRSRPPRRRSDRRMGVDRLIVRCAAGRCDRGVCPTVRPATMSTRWSSAAIERLARSVSVVGLGTWQLGADWGAVEPQAAHAVLDAAVEAGVTFFDTADVYGDGRSEQFCGELHARHPEILVATKMGRRVEQLPENYNREAFRAWNARSRANLGVERIDLVQLHCPPDEVYEDDAVFEALDELVEDGHIARLRRLGRDLRPGAAGDRAPARGERADHPQLLPAQAARAGAARGARGRRRDHRARAARLGSALGALRRAHDLRARGPSQLQPPRRGVRRRRDLRGRAVRDRAGRRARAQAAARPRDDARPVRAALGDRPARGRAP